MRMTRKGSEVRVLYGPRANVLVKVGVPSGCPFVRVRRQQLGRDYHLPVLEALEVCATGQVAARVEHLRSVRVKEREASLSKQCA